MAGSTFSSLQGKLREEKSWLWCSFLIVCICQAAIWVHGLARETAKTKRLLKVKQSKARIARECNIGDIKPTKETWNSFVVNKQRCARTKRHNVACDARQRDTYNWRSLILLIKNLMDDCALLLNSACWSSGNFSMTFVNQGCIEKSNTCMYQLWLAALTGVSTRFNGRCTLM